MSPEADILFTQREKKYVTIYKLLDTFMLRNYRHKLLLYVTELRLKLKVTLVNA